MNGAVTDHALARLRARIGVTQPHPQPPWYRDPGTDAFRHVAEACGDDNPLWCDPTYGPTTRWGGPIAPPHLNGGDTMIGENEVTHLDPDTKALLKGDPLKGAHAYYAGSFREWWAPLRPHTSVTRRRACRRARQTEDRGSRCTNGPRRSLAHPTTCCRPSSGS